MSASMTFNADLNSNDECPVLRVYSDRMIEHNDMELSSF